MSAIIPFAEPFTSQQAVIYQQQLRERRPLVHCLTNDVVQNFTANVLLAIGASPAMVIAREEVRDFVVVADSLLINIGTVNHSIIDSMLLAAESAYQTKTPWVLDPVAVSPILTYRTELAKQLLSFNPTVIRGNASEILVLAGEKSSGKGTDSLDSTDSALQAAQELAIKYQTIVAVTGAIDYVTDGKTTYAIHAGDEMLTRVTGTGCALSAMVAAFIGSNEDSLSAAAAACLSMSLAGERANKTQGLGTFIFSVLDHLSLDS
ncbi:hydroxyethylthiazole kinase [Zophobihabitans entericus]|uniref:Hydroxyethylthiazole kinase n=1 Tax=Zophobihabitans entericus TaxID=1635327 RepID=A0A6G9I8R9_9GAMM|nr:hydroxyethylthiazole kinase [Zophobihabitans entericus]QIQ20613.1 hydroxyethylthiazole kinase [Zophobihabitans entericus]